MESMSGLEVAIYIMLQGLCCDDVFLLNDLNVCAFLVQTSAGLQSVSCRIAVREQYRSTYLKFGK